MAEVPDEIMKQGFEGWLRLQRRDQNIRIAKTILIAIAFSISMTFAFFRHSGLSLETPKDYAALVKLQGAIQPGSMADSSKLVRALKEAFMDESAKGVVLLVNSGGGSPVQSMTIYREILRLKEKHKKPVVAVAEDAMASGAYLVAMAADTIYAMPSSTIGSIGVVMESLAYNELAEKLGIESRVYTSGESKRRFNPFAPEQASDVEKANQILSTIHRQFIDIVEASRSDRLSGPRSELYSGDFWTGEDALKFGLIDKIGTIYEALEAEFGVNEAKQFHIRSSFNEVIRAFGA